MSPAEPDTTIRSAISRVSRPSQSSARTSDSLIGRVKVDEVGDGLVTLFLCGDVMTGRGVDQILPQPGNPELRERYAGDARSYVHLAERANGKIPRPAPFGWPWGDALAILDEVAPDVRVINLETSITRSSEFAPGKAVHYRMSPGNLPCVAAVRRTRARWRTTTCSTSAAAACRTP